MWNIPIDVPIDAECSAGVSPNRPVRTTERAEIVRYMSDKREISCSAALQAYVSVR